MRVMDFLLHPLFLAILALSLACDTPTEEVRSESSEPVPAPLVEATEAVLEFPESVVWDQGSNAWYVSNFGGTIFADDSGAAPVKADENGFITKLSSNGEIDTLKWITGLHAPKGLGVHDGKLYAADVGQIVVMDIASARIESRIEVPNSQFLNGLAVDSSNGDVYVSDMMTNQILRYSQGSHETELFLESADLEMPNGLYVDGKTLVVGAWGVITDPATFGTDVKGRVKLIDLETKTVTNVGDGPIANIDGIFKFGDDYIVTDWAAGELIRISADGSATVLKSGYSNCADIGFDADRKAIAIPEMTPSGDPGRVSFFRLE
jgi:DNA-binding beta-propeller fold protein YncE